MDSLFCKSLRLKWMPPWSLNCLTVNGEPVKPDAPILHCVNKKARDNPGWWSGRREQSGLFASTGIPEHPWRREET